MIPVVSRPIKLRRGMALANRMEAFSTSVSTRLAISLGPADFFCFFIGIWEEWFYGSPSSTLVTPFVMGVEVRHIFER